MDTASFAPGSLNIRPLLAAEWESFRNIRLEALTLDAGAFGAHKNEEEQYNENDWRQWIQSHGRCVIGAFSGPTLIGISSVVTWRKELVDLVVAKQWPEGENQKTAFFVATYIKKSYRGLHLSQDLNNARLAWTLTQPQFRRILTAHRSSNTPAAKAHFRAGFTAIERKPYLWAGGVEEDLIICLREIDDKAKL